MANVRTRARGAAAGGAGLLAAGGRIWIAIGQADTGVSVVTALNAMGFLGWVWLIGAAILGIGGLLFMIFPDRMVAVWESVRAWRPFSGRISSSALNEVREVAFKSRDALANLHRIQAALLKRRELCEMHGNLARLAQERLLLESDGDKLTVKQATAWDEAYKEWNAVFVDFRKGLGKALGGKEFKWTEEAHKSVQHGSGYSPGEERCLNRDHEYKYRIFHHEWRYVYGLDPPVNVDRLIEEFSLDQLNRAGRKIGLHE